MAAMLDSYDMQILDYSGDPDIHMQPSTDPWFHDEAKMEEDSQVKTEPYTQEKIDTTIEEVDMEATLESHNTEYDMLDAEEIAEDILDREILDVEVYDASHVQSPTMFAVDSAQGNLYDQTFDTPTIGSPLHVAAPISLEEPHPLLELSEAQNTVSENTPAPEAFVQPSIYESESEEKPVTGIEPSETADLSIAEHQGQDRHVEDIIEVPVIVEAPAEGVEHHVQGDEDPTQPEESHSPDPGPDEQPTHVQPDEYSGSDNVHSAAEVHEDSESALVSGDAASTGDPHEISEGVYIDPPPPVLLSLGSEVAFDRSLFNDPSSWNEGSQSGSESKQAQPDHVLLQQLPTLYYEPLSTVFEALRQEEFIQSIFSLGEAELLLEAVDLRLTLTEDNIYSREITLHDLNVLHDVSGINGLLRVRLYTTSPRFITRYQHLQDKVSRLDISAEELSLPVQTTAADSTLHEGEPVKASTQLPEHETVEDSVAQEDPDQPKEYEQAEFQVANEEDQQFSHGTEAYTVQEEEEVHIEQGDNQQHYDGEGESSELTSHTQGQVQELQAHEEVTFSDESTIAQETNAILPLVSKDDTALNQDFGESNENNAEDGSSTPTHHSTPTPGSRDTGTSAHEDDDVGVIALETAEADLGEDDEGQGPYDEHKSDDDELQYPEYDEEDSQEFDDEYQEENQEVYQDDSTEQSQDQQEHEDLHHEYHDESHQTDVVEGTANLLSQTADEREQPILSDALGPLEPGELDNESIYEQASNLDQDANYEEESEYIDDDDANIEHLAATDSHIQEALHILHDTTDPLGLQPELPDFTGEEWGGDLDGEGEIDDTWDEDNEAETAQSNSNTSSVTLSSKASKRSYDEFDSDGGEDGDGNSHHGSPAGSPGPKRTRTQ